MQRSDDLAERSENDPVSRGAVVLLVLLVAVLLLAGAVAVLVQRSRAGGDVEGDQTAVLATARQTVTNLFTIDKADPKGSLDRLTSGATGEFKQQLVGQADELSKAVSAANASSTGTVSEAGVRAVVDDRAAVLVSALARVRGDKAPQGETLAYRMVVSLQRTDGVWLVSGLEFVP
jgi:Mce-associated membrane protein